MSSSAPTKKQLRPNTLPEGKGILNWLRPFFAISVGMKATTALTGALLTGFLIVHLIGNLNVLAGPDAVNGYAKFLKDLGPVLWIARGGLLTIFLLHVVLALWLAKRAWAARPIGYSFKSTIQATWASRTMPYTGLVILAFAAFHLAHYTFGAIETVSARSVHTKKLVQSNYLDLVDEHGRHDVYTMVVLGFSNPIVSAIYVVAMLLLFFHLKHGIGSVFQTLGLNTPRLQRLVRGLALLLAFLICFGNITLVALIWGGQVPIDPTPWTTAGPQTAQPTRLPGSPG